MTQPPASVNVASHLARMAATEPDRAAIHYPPRGVNPHGTTEHLTLTFARLNALADRLAYAFDSPTAGRTPSG